jgi:hypothetical protein
VDGWLHQNIAIRYDSVPSNENEELHLMEQRFWRVLKSLGFKVCPGSIALDSYDFKAGALHPNDAEGSYMALWSTIRWASHETMQCVDARMWTEEAQRIWDPRHKVRSCWTWSCLEIKWKVAALEPKYGCAWIQTQRVKPADGRLPKRAAISAIRWMIEWY